MKSINRRNFLKTSLAASALGVAPFNILKAGPSPNSKLNIACIGVGGMGGGEAVVLSREDNIVALCDVDEARFRGRSLLKDGVKLWKDYRVMFDKIGNKIDAIYTATPDHARFAVCMFAMKNGKHVFAQKPLCRTVNEARILTEEAKKHPRLVTQMGNQGHSTEGVAMVRDWIQGGCIGDVREVQVICRKNYCTIAEPVKGCAIPKTLEWDLFLNRAEEIPFSTSYINRNWIRYPHFSGIVGDMASHIFDPAYYALDLGAPISVEAKNFGHTPPEWTPKNTIITWEFAARGKMPPVTLKYYLGPDTPHPKIKHLEKDRLPKFMKQGSRAGGSFLVGEHASISAGEAGEDCRIMPEATMQATKKPPQVSYRRKSGHYSGTGHHLWNWTMAIKGEDKAMSHFGYAGPFSEMILLGDVAAMLPGRKLLWDSKNLRFTNDQEANKNTFMRRLAPRDDMNWI